MVLAIGGPYVLSVLSLLKGVKQGKYDVCDHYHHSKEIKFIDILINC
jgi:hypothetical protein